MLLQMANGSCFIHCEDCSGPLSPFSEVSYKIFLECRKQWLQLDGRQRDAALKTTSIISLEDEDAYDYEQLSFHRKCYSTFTNKTLLNRAEIRIKKAEAASKAERLLATSSDESSNGHGSVPLPKKVLHSKLASSSTSERSRRSEHVLPPVCIICDKEKSYYSDVVSNDNLERLYFTYAVLFGQKPHFDLLSI